MKKLALALVFGVVSMGAVSAQTTKTKVNKAGTEVKVKQENKGRHHEGKTERTPDERATRHTEKMTKELGLTADQAAKVKELNLQKAEKMTALKAQNSTDKKGLGSQMKDERANYEAGLKAVLTPAQFTAYQNKQAERRDKMKDKMKENHGQHKGQHKSN